MDYRKYAAELLGTFVFLALGYLSVAAAGAASTPALLVVPFGFGFGLLAAIFAFGHISGGHFNPAVTVAMWLDGRTPPVDAVAYIASQLIGAIAAGAVVLIAMDQQAVADGITRPGQGVSDIGAVIIETVATTAFVAVILASTRRMPSLAALAIPLTLVAIQFATFSLTGASVNPARSLGSALIGGVLSGIWIYIVGPIIGAILGWLAWRSIDGGTEASPAVHPDTRQAA